MYHMYTSHLQILTNANCERIDVALTLIVLIKTVHMNAHAIEGSQGMVGNAPVGH